MRRRNVAILAAAAVGCATALALLCPAGGPVVPRGVGAERREPEETPPLLAAPEGRADAGRRSERVPAEGDAGAEAPAAPGEVTCSLRLETVDAASGVPVPATWNLGAEAATVEAAVPEILGVPGGVVVHERAREGFAAWEAAFLPSGAKRPAALRPSSLAGFPSAIPLTVRPPPGYLPPDPSLVVTGSLAAGIRAATAVVPLDREAPLRLSVLGPDGRPAEGAVVVALDVGGRSLHVATEELGPGEFLVRGIPHRAGEPVAIAIDWGGTGDPQVPPTPQEGIADAQARCEVPADLSRGWSLVARLAGPTARRLLPDHVETENDLPTEESLRSPPAGPAGTARVKVLGWDGSAVRGATVLGRPADAHGVVVLAGLPAGERGFRVEPPGRLPAHAAAVVPQGGEVEVVLREPAGAVLDVLVTDEEGNPRPCALLALTGARVFDVVDGVQRLDAFADARGRRTFSRVEPGEVTVHASWASRHGSRTATLRDGERTSVHVVAR